MAYDTRLYYFQFEQKQIPLSNTIVEDGDFPRLNLFPVMLTKQVVALNDIVELYAVELPIDGNYEWSESAYTDLFDNESDPKVIALVTGLIGNAGFVLSRVREQTDDPTFGAVPGFNDTDKFLMDSTTEPEPGDDTSIKNWSGKVILEEWVS